MLLDVVVQALNPSTRSLRQVDLCKLEYSLVYKLSPAQPGLTILRNTISEIKGVGCAYL